MEREIRTQEDEESSRLKSKYKAYFGTRALRIHFIHLTSSYRLVQMSSISGGSWYHLDFVTPTMGVAGGNGACSFTSDAGAIWVSRSVDPNCPVMHGMDFRDQLLGLACSTMNITHGIYKTTDGSTTWEQNYGSLTNDVLRWSNTVVLATGLTSVYRSTDPGETWSVYASGITTGLLELERIDNATLAGVSAKGDVWRSTNEGLTWIQVFDDPGDLPASWSIQFSDSQHGWVVGQSGFICASDDSGLTWRQINNGVGVQIYDMQFLTDNFGIAAAHNRYVFSTTNGGTTWTREVVTPCPSWGYRIAGSPSRHLWIAGHKGMVVKRTAPTNISIKQACRAVYISTGFKWVNSWKQNRCSC